MSVSSFMALLRSMATTQQATQQANLNKVSLLTRIRSGC